MTIDGCKHSFHNLAQRVLPAYMHRMRRAMKNPVPLKLLAQHGKGPRAFLELIGIKDNFPGCYVLMRGSRPFYVGISRGVAKRIIQHIKGRTHFDASLADPELVEHIEIRDCPGEEGDYDLDVNTVPPKWVPNMPAIRARLLGEFEAEGFRRVAAVHPPHHISRLGLLPSGNREVKAAYKLIEGVKLAVNNAEDAMDLILDAEKLQAFEPTWPE